MASVPFEQTCVSLLCVFPRGVPAAAMGAASIARSWVCAPEAWAPFAEWSPSEQCVCCVQYPPTSQRKSRAFLINLWKCLCGTSRYRRLPLGRLMEDCCNASKTLLMPTSPVRTARCVIAVRCSPPERVDTHPDDCSFCRFHTAGGKGVCMRAPRHRSSNCETAARRGRRQGWRGRPLAAGGDGVPSDADGCDGNLPRCARSITHHLATRNSQFATRTTLAPNLWE